MKFKIFLIGLVLVLLTSCNASNASTELNNDKNATLTISGSGTASTVPDIVDIQLGVEAISNDPVESVSQNKLKMNAVMAVLDDAGITSSDIQTVYYNMWVEDVYDLEGQLTGEKRYHVTNQVNVRLRQFEVIGTLLESATRAGATNIAGISFGVADTTELEQKALDNAIADAKEKAEHIASGMSMTLGKINNFVESGFYSPSIPYYGDKGGLGGGAPVPISQGQFSMTVQVQIVYELIP